MAMDGACLTCGKPGQHGQPCWPCSYREPTTCPGCAASDRVALDLAARVAATESERDVARADAIRYLTDCHTAERDLAAAREALGADALLEQLSALAHEQWSGWVAYMLNRLASSAQRPGEEEPVARWRRQIATPYGSLSESERDSDRREAMRVLAVIRAALGGQP